MAFQRSVSTFVSTAERDERPRETREKENQVHACASGATMAFLRSVSTFVSTAERRERENQVHACASGCDPVALACEGGTRRASE